jgi:voltage-gated potassium channel Kch
VTATATSADGSSVTRARSVEAFPQVLVPGELALATVQFRRHGVAPGATVAVKVRSTPVAAANASRALAVSGLTLSPPQTGSVAQRLTAVVQNPTTAWTARSPRVAVMCFGESRQPTTITTTRVGVARIRPGKQATVAVPLATLCPTYLVAARAT